MGHCFLEQVGQVLSSQNHYWGMPQSQSLTDPHDHRNYSLVIVTGVGTHCLRAGLRMSVVTLHQRVGVISLPLEGEGGILQSCLPLVEVWKLSFQIPLFWSFCKRCEIKRCIINKYPYKLNNSFIKYKSIIKYFRNILEIYLSITASGSSSVLCKFNILVLPMISFGKYLQVMLWTSFYHHTFATLIVIVWPSLKPRSSLGPVLNSLVATWASSSFFSHL